MWLMILQFLINFPSLVKTVIEIWKLIKQIRDSDQKKVFEERLRAVIKRRRGPQEVSDLDRKKSLDEIFDDLRGSAKVP